jgi:hypothetical protein|tara:strand:- start:219 stop:329 length:111 start_codon:yes stop_codon:yes gene_type:complete
MKTATVREIQKNFAKVLNSIRNPKKLPMLKRLLRGA